MNMTDEFKAWYFGIENFSLRCERLAEMSPDERAYTIWSQSRAAIEKDAALPVVPEGWKLVPDWKGYALLGTGGYLINHSADFDPELGAELVITLATDADRTGDRQIGESRDNPSPSAPIQADDMVIRIGFLSERALFALEDQLAQLRAVHFPAAPSQPGNAPIEQEKDHG